MSGFVSSLVSSRSLLAAASLRDTTVAGSRTGVGSTIVGCCSIMRFRPPSDGALSGWSGPVPRGIGGYRTHDNGFRQAGRRNPMVPVAHVVAESVLEADRCRELLKLGDARG